MKKIKFLFICFVVIFLSGCSVDYQLTINDDLSLNEEVTASEYSRIIQKKTNMDDEEAVDYLYYIFSRNLESESFSSEINDGKVTGVVRNSFPSLKQFPAYTDNDMFSEMKYSEKDDKVSLKISQIKKLGNSGGSSLLYDDVTVRIKLPFKVTNHNADRVGKNEYIWYFEKDKDLRTIELEFDKSRNANSFIFNANNKKINVNYVYVFIVAIVLIISSIVVFIAINNKKNNSF